MNQNSQLSTPTTAGQKLSVPILMFEVMDMAVPVKMAEAFTPQDKLRDDKDLVEDFRYAQGPTCWSPLNDF